MNNIRPLPNPPRNGEGVRFPHFWGTEGVNSTFVRGLIPQLPITHYQLSTRADNISVLPTN